MMLRRYTYSDFKQELTTNPKWILRSLCLLHDGKIRHGLLSSKNRLIIKAMVYEISRRTSAEGLSWLHHSPRALTYVAILKRHAPAIYNHYVQLNLVSETTV